MREEFERPLSARCSLYASAPVLHPQWAISCDLDFAASKRALALARPQYKKSTSKYKFTVRSAGLWCCFKRHPIGMWSAWVCGGHLRQGSHHQSTFGFLQRNYAYHVGNCLCQIRMTVNRVSALCIVGVGVGMEIIQKERERSP